MKPREEHIQDSALRTPRWLSRVACRVAVTATALLCGGLCGCEDSLPGKPDASERYKRPDEIMDFAVLYGKHCSGCHGAEGTLGPAPPLNDPLFLAICPEKSMRKTIENGRTGTSMPSFSQKNGGPITEKQIDAIISGLKANWAKPVDDPDVPSYLQPTESASSGSLRDLDAGKAAFKKFCANCHGTNGVSGDDDPAGSLNDVAFLALVSNQALRRIIITGRPDLGMPGYRRSGGDKEILLTDQDVSDIVALMNSWRAKLIAENE